MIVTGANVAKRWGPDLGLAPVDFAIEPGALVCVRGRSGTGKSTLLALLWGLTDPDAGTLTWSPGFEPPADAPWAVVAFVPQTMLVLAELSVAENVALAAASATRVDDVLGRLGLGDLGLRRIDALSNGQRQRVAVARAVVARPRLLLADEPTSHQDAVSAQLVIAALRHEADRGAAVVVASHDPAVVAAADTVLDLDRSG